MTIYRSISNTAAGRCAVASEITKGDKRAWSSRLAGATLLAISTMVLLPQANAQTIVGGGVAANGIAIGSGGGCGPGNPSGFSGTATATGGYSPIVIGCSTVANGDAAVAIGTYSTAAGIAAVALGDQSWAAGNNATALGRRATASADGAIAAGAFSMATGVNSVALGANSLADRGNSVSVGAAGNLRQIVNMAAGTADTDAVNVLQLKGVTAALGGGSVVNADGSVSAPTYTMTNANGTTSAVTGVQGAISNLDSRVHGNTVRLDTMETGLSSLSTQINNGGIGMVQQANAGEQLTVGKNTDGASVNFTGTAGDRALTGVAAGKAGNDAVNVSQLNARLQTQGSQVISQANSYTDSRFNSAIGAVDNLRRDVDDRFITQDQRIDRISAMSGAMTTMASSMSGVRTANRVGVGAGVANGRLAMAVGYQRAFDDDRAAFTIGGSFTDEDQTVGVGGGFGW